MKNQSYAFDRFSKLKKSYVIVSDSLSFKHIEVNAHTLLMVMRLNEYFEITQVKGANNEHQIEHIFESLFDNYRLNYQAQEHLVKDRPG